MPLIAVQNYVKGLLDGLAVPGQDTQMDFYITPPVIQDMNGPHGYITGGRVAASRQTSPRIKARSDPSTAGYKKYPWRVEIYAVYETQGAQTNPTADLEFPQILESIATVFETTQMPQWLDANGTPVPGNVPIPYGSQIQAIGETWTMDYPPEHVPATLRMLWYVAMFTLDVLEVYQR